MDGSAPLGTSLGGVSSSGGAALNHRQQPFSHSRAISSGGVAATSLPLAPGVVKLNAHTSSSKPPLPPLPQLLPLPSLSPANGTPASSVSTSSSWVKQFVDLAKEREVRELAVDVVKSATREATRGVVETLIATATGVAFPSSSGSSAGGGGGRGGLQVVDREDAYYRSREPCGLVRRRGSSSEGGGGVDSWHEARDTRSNNGEEDTCDFSSRQQGMRLGHGGGGGAVKVPLGVVMVTHAMQRVSMLLTVLIMLLIYALCYVPVVGAASLPFQI